MAPEEKWEQALQELSIRESDKVDAAFADGHDTVFAETDCLSCANCCKTTSPIIEQADMDMLAEGLSVSRSELIRDYLTMDEDGDFVFRSAPCPMLLEDNRCKVYAHRPEACRDYPHTRRKNMIDVFDITLKNAAICPAVGPIIERAAASFL